ncbi:MAG: hypothetical protein ACT6FE_00270 [Methanosarcinaceae archaeon]
MNLAKWPYPETFDDSDTETIHRKYIDTSIESDIPEHGILSSYQRNDIYESRTTTAT